MKLLTKALRERLLKNGRNRDQDHAPALKVFNPHGGRQRGCSPSSTRMATRCSVWPISVSAPRSWATHACPSSPRSASVSASASMRDLHFKPRFALSTYAEAARAAGTHRRARPRARRRRRAPHHRPRLTASRSPPRPVPVRPGAGRLRFPCHQGDAPCPPPNPAPALRPPARRRPCTRWTPWRGENLSPKFAAILAWAIGRPAMTEPAITGIVVSGECVFAATDADPYFQRRSLAPGPDLEANLRGWGAACRADPAAIDGLVDKVRRASQ